MKPSPSLGDIDISSVGVDGTGKLADGTADTSCVVQSNGIAEDIDLLLINRNRPLYGPGSGRGRKK